MDKELRAKKRRVKRIIDNIVWCSAWLMVIMTLLIVINNQNVTHEKINDLSNKIDTMEQSVKDGNKMLKNEGQAVTNVSQVLDNTDRDYIERVVAAEARGTSIEEMEAVAQTIKDRSELWNMTLTEVLNQPYQYAEPYGGEVNDNVKLAVANVFDNGVRVFQEPTTHFHNDTVNPYWVADKECRGTIDRTSFYY